MSGAPTVIVWVLCQPETGRWPGERTAKLVTYLHVEQCKLSHDQPRDEGLEALLRVATLRIANARTRAAGGLSVHGIAGTYVVLLGFNMPEGECDGLLGFSIHRTDHTE